METAGGRIGFERRPAAHLAGRNRRGRNRGDLRFVKPPSRTHRCDTRHSAHETQTTPAHPVLGVLKYGALDLLLGAGGHLRGAATLSPFSSGLCHTAPAT